MIDGRKELADGTVLIDKLGNRYALGKVLGRGGSGLVYSAKKKGNALELAIKESFPFDAGIVRAEDGVSLCIKEDADELMRIVAESAERERMIGAAIIEENPNAEAIYEQLDICAVENPDETVVTSISQRFYLSVSLKGKAERLDELVKLQQEKMNILDCIELFKECIAAIGMIHERGYVHLDISASNMYLFGCRLEDKKWGICKVIDFGNAKKIDESGNVIWEDRRSFHSPGFGAPELRRGQYSLVSQKTDIYSLGVLFYYILYSGRVLREGEKARIMGVRAEKLGARYCLEMINHILLKATSVNVDERYETVSELMDAVESLENEVKQPEELVAPIDVPRNFDNRGSEIEEFLGKMEKGSRFQIWGESGIGKTTFAAMLLERYKDEHPEARVFFVRYTGSIRDTFALLHSNKETDNDDYSLSSSAVKEERFRKNMDILGRCRKDDILYLDNFYSDSVGSIQELRVKEGEYYRQIESLPMKVVISTRYRGTTEGYLGPLSQEELDKTFFSELPEVSTEKRMRFYSLLDWNTYLIQLILSSVELHPVTCPFDMLFQSLCEKSNRVSEFEVVSEKDGMYSVDNYLALLETVWSVVALPQDEQVVLYLCAVLIPEDGIKSDLFDKCIMRTEYITCFERLINKNWVIWDKEEKKYFLHDTARVMAMKYIDKREVVWEFLWHMAESGDVEQYAPVFAYADVNRRIKMGIFFYGVGNYRHSCHCFYHFLSMMHYVDERYTVLALEGIAKSLGCMQYIGNEVFIDLFEEQLVQSLNFLNLFDYVIVGKNASKGVDDSYTKVIKALCNILVNKYEFDKKKDWNETKRKKYEETFLKCVKSREWIGIHEAWSDSYFLFLNNQVKDIKNEFIKMNKRKFSHITLLLMELIWDCVPMDYAEHHDNSDKMSDEDKWDYELKVQEEFETNPSAKWICKDSMIGLIESVSWLMYGVLSGEVSIAEVYDTVNVIVREIEEVDSVLMQELCLYYGIFLAYNKEWSKALDYYNRSMSGEFYEPRMDKRMDELTFRKLSEAYYALGQIENAVYYQRMGLALYIEKHDDYLAIVTDNEDDVKEDLEYLISKYDKGEEYIQKEMLEEAYLQGLYNSMQVEEEFSLLFGDIEREYRSIKNQFESTKGFVLHYEGKKYECDHFHCIANLKKKRVYAIWTQLGQPTINEVKALSPGIYVSEIGEEIADYEYEALNIKELGDVERRIRDAFLHRFLLGDFLFSR